MGKKTELRVWLEGHEVDLLNDFMRHCGQKTWTATVRAWLASTKTPQAREKHGSTTSIESELR
jgi:hypothetical protein